MDQSSQDILRSWRKILKSNIEEHGKVPKEVFIAIRKDFKSYGVGNLYRDHIRMELQSIRAELLERRGQRVRVRLIVDGKDRYKNAYTRRTGEYKAIWLRGRGHRVELRAE